MANSMFGERNDPKKIQMESFERPKSLLKEKYSVMDAEQRLATIQPPTAITSMQQYGAQAETIPVYQPTIMERSIKNESKAK